MRKTALGVLVASGILAGCVASSAQFVPPVAKKASSVELNARSTARVGDPMISERDYQARPGAVIQGGVSGFYKMARFNVPAGTSLVQARMSDAFWYCTTQPMVFSGAGIPMGSACFRDADGDGAFDLLDNTISGFGSSSMDPVSYKPTEAAAGDSFKYELIYQGIAQNVLRLAYREYGPDLDAPPKAQELSYTLARPDDEITFRGARIRVHSANNNQIEYTVLSGLTR